MVADPSSLQEREPSGAPFAFAALAVMIASAAVPVASDFSPRGVGVFLAGVVVAMVFLVLPSWLDHRTRVLDRLAVALARLEERQYDLESVRREHRKAQARAEEAQDRLAELVARVEEQARNLADLARFREELVAARQEARRHQNRLEDWVGGLVDHLDDQYRLLSHDGVSADYHAGVERGLGQLVRTLRSLGLDVIDPGPGEPFDDRMHRAAETGPATDDTPAEHVLACLQPGYRRGENILRPAEVRLALASRTHPTEVRP